MCFGGGGGQPQQPMNTPSYSPEDSHTAVTKTVTTPPPLDNKGYTGEPSSASVPKQPTGTGLDIGSM